VAKASPIELVQQSPKPGQPTPFRTTVRVLGADNKLYFGFECTDPNPNAIAVHTMRRDGDVAQVVACWVRDAHESFMPKDRIDGF